MLDTTKDTQTHAKRITKQDWVPIPVSQPLRLELRSTSHPPISCINVSVQTAIEAPIQSLMLHDDESTQTSIVSCINTSVQASEPSGPSPSPSQPQKTSAAPLDWAEDANTLPIIPLSSSPHQPHDLSVLRSSSSFPFSSLQHRSKCFSHYSRQPHRHSHSNFNSFYTPHHISFKPHSHTKTYSHLNWESDP